MLQKSVTISAHFTLKATNSELSLTLKLRRLPITLTYVPGEVNVIGTQSCKKHILKFINYQHSAFCFQGVALDRAC